MRMVDSFAFEFIEFYPLKRYIFTDPKPIENLFNNILLTEIFILSAETTLDEYTEEEVCVKLFCEEEIIKMSYFDFADHIKENIIDNFICDFGSDNWNSLTCLIEPDDKEEECIIDADLESTLQLQKDLIEFKYGET